MSRQEAAEQYAIALKAGQKCRKECLIQGKYPYPQVLDEIFDESMAAGRVELGTINIPTEHIVGTKTGGRQNAFAANFMPLLGEETEFAHKWISLCETNLSDEGIRDPIRCCEYMGRFYVQEGNKRVSVLKSFGAPSIPAVVTRIIPAWSQEHEVRLYYEFMRFYQLSRLYILSFSRLGSYVKLQAALGFDADHVWSEEERRSFSAAYYSFRTALEKCEGSRFPETIGDALLIFLQVFSFGELKAMTQTELERSITGIWPEVEVQARPAPITVNTESSVEVKGVLTKLMDSIRLPSHLNVAFVNELPPEKSAWIMSHDRGREYLERHMPDKVTTRVYNIDAEHDADALIPIGSPFWNWGEMYVHIIENILGGGWDELSYKNSGKAVNYWWGMSSGVIDVRVTENCPDSMAELVDILKRGISSGLIMPFHRKITAQSGGAINDGTRWLSPDELLHMDWLCSCVEGSIPGFDELLPMAQSLVRLLGVYRDWIIPDKGEVQV